MISLANILPSEGSYVVSELQNIGVPVERGLLIPEILLVKQLVVVHSWSEDERNAHLVDDLVIELQGVVLAEVNLDLLTEL